MKAGIEKSKKRSRNTGNKMPEERQKRRIKLVLISLICLLAVISGIIFLNSRGGINEGMSVEFTTRILDDHGNVSLEERQIVAGKDAQLTFRLINKKTGEAISGLDPGISFFLLGNNNEVLEHQHIGSALFGNEMNLAKIQLFVANSEKGTIEIVDIFGNNDPRPQTMQSMGLMSSKLIAFKGAPKQKIGDFLAGRYGDYLYATLPRENQVAVVNTLRLEVEKYIDVGVEPGTLFLQPKSKYLWVSDEGSSSVSIIDTINNTLMRTIATGEGYHQIAFSPEFAYVTNNKSNTVSVIRLKDLTKVGYTTVENSPYGIDYSNVSNSVYVANTYSGTVSVLDDRTHDFRQRILLSPGIETLKVSPDGRLAVVLNQYEDKAYIIDAQTGNINRTVRTAQGPDYVFFMGDYAIIHNIYDSAITYFNLYNTNISNNVPVSSQPPLEGKPHVIAVSYYGDELVLTNPKDPYVYFMHTMYGEPMPMSSATAGFGSDAVVIVENKPHETGPGIYQQYIKFDKAGPYDVELKTPEINATFRLEVLPDPNKKEFRVVSLFKDQVFKSGVPSEVQYQITDARTGKYIEDLKDAIFIVIKPPSIKGTWSNRVQTRNAGNGTYEATITFPDEGYYIIALSSNTLKSNGYEGIFNYVTVNG